jgi:aminoglycoside phosphotransferase (APT) family kinase protein
VASATSQRPAGIYVLKQALAAGSILALGARAFGPQPYPLALGTKARIAREASALCALRDAGVAVPRVHAVRGSSLLLEHVAGEPLPRTLARPGAEVRIAAYARALRAVHAAGYVLNDAHPGNALVDGDRVTLIDLEFAERCSLPERRAFDLAYAASYFTAAERRVFGVAPITGMYAPLFAYERERQRRAA